VLDKIFIVGAGLVPALLLIPLFYKKLLKNSSLTFCNQKVSKKFRPQRKNWVKWLGYAKTAKLLTPLYLMEKEGVRQTASVS